MNDKRSAGDGGPAGRCWTMPPVGYIDETPDFGNLQYCARLGPLDGLPVWRSFEREVSSCPVIVREVAGQDAARVPLAQHEDMVQTLVPY